MAPAPNSVRSQISQPSEQKFKPQQTVKLLVANKTVMSSEGTWNRLEYPVLKGTDGVYFLDDTDEFRDLVKNLSSVCKKPVTRVHYIDSDNDDVPIDGDVELREALKFIEERTNRGRFTTMKVETDLGGDFGSSKKSKASKGKKMHKAIDVDAARKARSKGAGSLKDSFTLKDMPLLPDIPSSKEESMTKNLPVKDQKTMKVEKSKIEQVLEEDSKSKPTKAWLKTQLKQLKSEIMTEVETLLEPLIKEQERLNGLIASLQEAHLEAKMSFVNTKQSESDHNYCAASKSQRARDFTDSFKKHHNLANITSKSHKDVPTFKKVADREGEILYPWQDCTDDENISICSGEISVTESESETEEISDHSVDVPLPACFDVVGSSKDISSSRAEHDGINSKAEEDEGCTEETMFQSRPSAELNGHPKKINIRIRKMNLRKKFELMPSRLAKTSNFIEEKLNDSPCSNDGKNDEVNQNFGDNAEENIDHYEAACRGLDNDHNNSVHDFDGHSEESVTKGFGVITHLSPCQRIPSNNFAKQNSVQSHNQECLTSASSFPINIYSPLKDMPSFSSTQKEPGTTPRYSEVPTTCATEMYSANGAREMSVHGSPLQQQWINPHQPALVLSGDPTQGTNIQHIQQASKSSLPQFYMSHHMSKLQTDVKSAPTTASLIAQHQQIVVAAQRAAHQAQRTQALGLGLAQTSDFEQQKVSLSGAQDGQNIDRESGGIPSNQNGNLNDNSGLNPGQAGANISETSQMVKAAHENKLWDEVDQVDLELRKWIHMCKELMENPPKNIENKEAAMTYHELDKVYQKFRRDIQLVSTEIDAQKLQSQQLKEAGSPVSEDPILILPEKLMQTISATLNTTLNILGSISNMNHILEQKPSCLPTTGPPTVVSSPPSSERCLSNASNSFSSGIEKAQTQSSVLQSTMTSGKGYGGIGYTTKSVPYSYYYPYVTTVTNTQNTSSNKILQYTPTGQETSVSYHMLPEGTSSSSGLHHLVWKHNVPTYSVNPAITQPQLLRQNAMQNQYLQSQSQNKLYQTQQQIQPSVQQPHSPMHFPMYSQFHPQMSIQMLSPYRSQDICASQAGHSDSLLDSSYTSLPLNDYPLLAPEPHTNTSISVVYSDKNSTGFCAEAKEPPFKK